MGCGSSSAAAAVPPPQSQPSSRRPSRLTEPPPPPPPPAADPTVIESLKNALAFIPATHQGFRTCSALMERLVHTGNWGEFEKLWNDYQRAFAYHSGIEDSYIFPHIDDVSNYQITRKKVGEDHEKERELMSVVNDYLRQNLRVAEGDYLEWANFSMEHLDREEAVILPCEPKLHSSSELRMQFVFKKMITPCFVNNKAEFLWFVGWVMNLVSNYGCEDCSPIDCIGFLAMSLQQVSTLEQYEAMKVYMKAQCASGAWEKASKAYGIDQTGAQKTPAKAPAGEDQRYEKYFKMMKYGIPREAVAQKMVMERAAAEVDEAISILELDPELPIPPELEQYLSLSTSASQAPKNGAAEV